MKVLSFLGPGAVFDHVGVAVRSITDVAGSDVEIVDDCRQGVSVAFVSLGGATLELIQPLGEGSPVDSSLQRGHTLVHLCFRVPSLDDAVASARLCGLHRVARPVPARAFDDRPIVWLFGRTVGLIELVEDSPTSADRSS